MVSEIKGHDGPVNAVSFRDGLILSGGDDCFVKLGAFCDSKIKPLSQINL